MTQKRKTEPSSRTIVERTGQKWLTFSKIEFWFCFGPTLALAMIALFCILFAHPSIGIALGFLVVSVNTPYAYVAWLLAIISIIAVLRTRSCNSETRTKIIYFLLPVSIMLVGFSTIAFTRGKAFYVLGAFIIAWICWMVFKFIIKEKKLGKNVLKLLTIIVITFLIISIIMTVSGELYYRLVTIPERREGLAILQASAPDFS